MYLYILSTRLRFSYLLGNIFDEPPASESSSDERSRDFSSFRLFVNFEREKKGYQRMKKEEAGKAYSNVCRGRQDYNSAAYR